MTRGTRAAALPSPQRGTAVDSGSAVSPHRHPKGANGVNGARPGRKSEYVLLTPEDPAGDPASLYTQICGDGHKSNMDTGDQGKRETETGGHTRQRALLARGMPEEAGKERRPPK